MKTAGFIFAAILSAVIMLGTVVAVANSGMTANTTPSHVVATS